MQNSNYQDNTPNAGKLIDSLRNTGYNNITAIADLIDNSIDAGAQNVWFTIEPTRDSFRVILADDGRGMSLGVLDQAMRLGSDTSRDANSDLGKFGMGLVTASISIGKRLTVITRQNGQTITSIQDLDQIAETGKFVKELREASSDENGLFDHATKKAKSGTVLVIEKCDRIQNTNINGLCKRLAAELGQIFRKFLSARNIYVRGAEIKPIDPLFLDNDSTETFSDETFEIATESGQTENMRIRIAALPDFDQDTNRRYGINQKNQGFYLMRNNREIASGEDLGIFTKHNDLNRLRIELFFTANLDNEMGVNFTKRDIKPSQSIVDKIHQVTYPQISSFRKRIRTAKATSNTDKIDHDAAAKNISAMSNILITPIEKFEPRNTVGAGQSSTTAPGESQDNDSPIKKMNCEFKLRDNGPGGNLFDMEQIGKRIVIYYNVQHPFYQNFIIANKDNKDIVNAIDYLVYSLASAQLISQNQENQVLFDNFNSFFSSNLRALIN